MDDPGLSDLMATPQQVGLSAEGLAQIAHTAERFVAEGRLAGATTIVARHGRVAHLATCGLMDLDAQRPMSADAIFRIYSMTKPVAAAAVMMLREAGQVDLDAPVAEYLPEFGGMQAVVEPDADPIVEVAAEREIGVRDLLRHTSGLPGANRYIGGSTAVDRLYRRHGLDRFEDGDLAAMVAKLGQIPLLYQPGRKWHYSIAADVLGRLIEVVSGRGFDEFLAERIFAPLGMVDTAFYVPAQKLDRLVGMYGPDQGGRLQTINAPQGGTGVFSADAFTCNPSFLSAGGGLVSTAADFTRFCLMLSNKGELAGTRLLQTESIEEMIRNQLPPKLIPLDKEPAERYGGLGFGLGVSVRVEQTDWVPASQVGEYGWIGGTSTEFWIAPQDELVAIVLVQHMPFSPLSEVVKPQIYAALSD